MELFIIQYLTDWSAWENLRLIWKHNYSLPDGGHCFVLCNSTGTIGRWVRFPYYRMTTVSRTWRCRNYTRMNPLVTARTRYPSTWQLRGPPLARKAIQNFPAPFPAVGFLQLSRSSATCLWWVIRWLTRDITAISSPHSLQETPPFWHSLYVGPPPMIRLPYPASDWFPATW